MHTGRARGSAIWARSLSTVRLAGDLEWFEPAIDRIRALRTDPNLRARDFISLESATYIARAPGRLDVMGGFADYSGGTVLQLPLDRATFVALQWQDDASCEILTRRSGRWDWFSIPVEPLVTGELRHPAALAAWFRARPTDHWAAYVIGAVQYCFQRRPGRSRLADSGLRLLIDSTVSEGKGVSSSAALEVAAMTAVATALELEIAPEDLATACQWVENHIVGAPCGIMDQMASECGQRDRLMRLRCQPGTVEGQLRIPKGYQFYGIDSGLRHAVTGADYGTVRAAAFMGYTILAESEGLKAARTGNHLRIDDPIWGGYLANISPSDFSARLEQRLPERMTGEEYLARYGGTTDAVTTVDPNREYPVRAAAAHPIRERERVARFSDLLAELPGRPEAAMELGALMRASHESYSACGLGSDGTDRLVELVTEAGPELGLFGAKITGGGSGGTVAVFGTTAALDAVRSVAARYSSETGRASEVFAGSGPGVAETGTLILEQ